jgi:hypothetical protein
MAEEKNSMAIRMGPAEHTQGALRLMALAKENCTRLLARIWDRANTPTIIDGADIQATPIFQLTLGDIARIEDIIANHTSFDLAVSLSRCLAVSLTRCLSVSSSLRLDVPRSRRLSVSLSRPLIV